MTSLRVSPRKLLSQPPTPSSGRYLVSSRRRNPQLHLCTRIEFTPHRQLAAHQLGAFAHAPQTVVFGASLLIKMLRVNALPIIPEPQPKLPFVIPDFHFDPLRLCVLEGIAQCFPCDPVDFVSEDRMEILRGSFNIHVKLGSIWVRFTGREFLTQSVYRQRKIAGHDRG